MKRDGRMVCKWIKIQDLQTFGIEVYYILYKYDAFSTIGGMSSGGQI